MRRLPAIDCRNVLICRAAACCAMEGKTAVEIAIPTTATGSIAIMKA